MIIQRWNDIVVSEISYVNEIVLRHKIWLHYIDQIQH